MSDARVRVISVGDDLEPTPRKMWDNFTKLLAEKEGQESTNFLGSIASYRKIFLEANPSGLGSVYFDGDPAV